MWRYKQGPAGRVIIIHLTLCLLGNFACFFVICTFDKNQIFQQQKFINAGEMSMSEEAKQNAPRYVNQKSDYDDCD